MLSMLLHLIELLHSEMSRKRTKYGAVKHTHAHTPDILIFRTPSICINDCQVLHHLTTHILSSFLISECSRYMYDKMASSDEVEKLRTDELA